MDLVTPLMQTLQANANLEHTESVTQDTRALAQLRQFGLLQSIMTQQQLAQAWQGVGSPQTQVGSGDPGQIAQSNTTGAMTPGGTGLRPASDYDGPLGQTYHQLDLLRQQQKTQLSLATSLGSRGLPAAESYAKAAAEIGEKIATVSDKLVTQRAAMMKQVANAFSDVKDQQGLDNAIAIGNSIDPSIVRSIAMDRDPVTFQPKATPTTLTNIKQFSDVGWTKAEKATEQFRQATLAETVSRDAATQAFHNAELVRQQQATDANIELRRTGQEALQAQRETNNYNRNISQATTINNQYETQSKDFKEVVPRVVAATNYLIDAQTGQMKPNSQLNSSGDRLFSEAFIKTVYPDYHGSVYDHKSLAQLPGLADKIVQGIKNLASGQMIPRDVKADMYGAMQLAFQPMNEMQTQREDSAMTRAQRAGVPTDLANVYIPPYALRPKSQSTGTGGTGIAPAANDRMLGPDGKYYNYIGGPGGDRTQKSNWRAE